MHFEIPYFSLSQWYHTYHSLNTKIIKKLQLTLQNGAGCCIYPCDVISSACYSAVELTIDSFIPILVCTLNPASNLSIAEKYKNMVMRF